MTTITSVITWLNILVAYIAFRKALAAQGVDRNTLIFKSKWQPYTAYCALVFFLIIVVFNGFAVFTKGNWSVQDFVTVSIIITFISISFTNMNSSGICMRTDLLCIFHLLEGVQEDKVRCKQRCGYLDRKGGVGC